ncbi:hypothetical protein MRB53_012065 [Persea americana]|uniref:Uncharacterized protein n=1 Tax=Persea americana TaxID=3435 RepID=A0ACC2LX49_PERAE|nr:hypothetical protein MRB53_012065 [Persea americana]
MASARIDVSLRESRHRTRAACPLVSASNQRGRLQKGKRAFIASRFLSPPLKIISPRLLWLGPRLDDFWFARKV